MARKRSGIEPRIVRAARERFLAEGVDGASLRRIAADARTNLGMVYYYYKTKDDLFLAVVEDVYAGLLVDLEVALSLELPFEERIARTYARFGALSDDEFTVLRLVLREAMLSSARLGSVIRRFTAGHIGLVMAAFLEGIGSGRVRGDLDPSALFPCLAGLAVGVLFARRLQEATREGKATPPFAAPDPREVAKAAAEVLLRGVSRRPGGRSVARAKSGAATQRAASGGIASNTPRSRGALRGTPRKSGGAPAPERPKV